MNTILRSTLVSRFDLDQVKQASTAGFELAPAKPNRFQVCLRNHSDISTFFDVQPKGPIFSIVIQTMYIRGWLSAFNKIYYSVCCFYNIWVVQLGIRKFWATNKEYKLNAGCRRQKIFSRWNKVASPRSTYCFIPQQKFVLSSATFRHLT